MKAKRLAPLALLLPLMLLAACGGNTDLDLQANWYSDPVHANIQSDKEELSYEVTYTPPASKDPLASFEYETGTYKTTLQERSSLASYAAWAKGTGYTYHAELKIAGSYTYGGKTESFEDTVTSDVVFMNVDNLLRPVRSDKRYNVTTYYAGAVVNYNYAYTATYNEKLSETEIAVRDLRENVSEENSLNASKKIKLKGSGTFLDNEEIFLALRGLDLTVSSTFRTVNPVTRERMNVATSSSKETKYVGSFTVDGAPTGEIDVKAVSFSIGYTASKSGMAQSLVYALPSSDHDFRNVLLEMTTVAPDGAGSFTYKLKEMNFFGNN